MAMLTVRNLPDGVHRALRARASRRGHSMEAEVREILESAVSPQGRVKLGSIAVFEPVRSKAPGRPPSFE